MIVINSTLHIEAVNVKETVTCRNNIIKYLPYKPKSQHVVLIAPKTFILQAIFASSIPEIIDLVGTRSKYCGEYKREHGKRYTHYLLQDYRLFSILQYA